MTDRPVKTEPAPDAATSKRPYVAPEVRSDETFTRLALGCNGNVMAQVPGKFGQPQCTSLQS